MSRFLFNLGFYMENIGVMILWWGVLLLAVYPISMAFDSFWWVSSSNPWMKWGVPLIHFGAAASGILINIAGRWIKVSVSGSYLKEVLSGRGAVVERIDTADRWRCVGWAFVYGIITYAGMVICLKAQKMANESGFGTLFGIALIIWGGWNFIKAMKMAVTGRK